MEQISGVAGGMPYLALPRGCAPRAPLVVAWHLHDRPRSETAMSAPLAAHRQALPVGDGPLGLWALGRRWSRWGCSPRRTCRCCGGAGQPGDQAGGRGRRQRAAVRGQLPVDRAVVRGRRILEERRALDLPVSQNYS
jgi:hypothetical protein